MTFLIFEEFNLLFSLLNFDFLPLLVSLLDGINLRFEFLNFVLQFGLLALELFNSFLEVGLTVLSLELLSHGEGNRALIKSLIGSDCHLDLISDSEKKQASLWLAQSNLPDNLIKALRKELLSDWADTALSGLPLHELLIEHLSEPGHVNS